MPLYDYRCDVCGKAFEQVAAYHNRTLPSPCCEGAQASRLVSIGGVRVFGTQTFDDLHLDDDLKEITSKEQLARECHKAGVYSKQLLGSDKYERIMRGEY